MNAVSCGEALIIQGQKELGDQLSETWRWLRRPGRKWHGGHLPTGETLQKSPCAEKV